MVLRRTKTQIKGKGLWGGDLVAGEVGREAAGGMCLLSKCLDKFEWRL